MDDFISVAVLLSCIVMFCAYLIGIWSNPFWKCKQLRSFLKKNYVIIALLDKDRKGMIMSVVNAVKGKIKYRDFNWYITDGSIWRVTEINAKKDKVEAKAEPKQLSQGDSSRLLSNEPRKHYFMDNITYEEGTPIVFLDMDTLTPVGFENSPAKVKANEISAFLQADWLNEYAKMQAQNKQLSLMLIMSVILVLANIVVTYVMVGGNSEKLTAIQGQVSILSNMQNSINMIMAKEGLLTQGATMQNGTMVIPTK